MKLKVVAVLATIALFSSGGVAVAAVGPLGINGPGLAAVGPSSPTDGFPVWYKDKTGLRLQNCLDPDDLLCPPVEVPDPGAPISFPDNYPGEAFYARAAATIPAANDEEAFVEMQLEQAFGADIAQAGDQVTFARVRYNFDLANFASVDVTSPVGTTTLVADDRGRIRATEDLGLGGPIDFSGALGGRIGPFLTWDTYGNVPAPAALMPDAITGKAAYIGNPGILHKIKGSAYNTNFFRAVSPGINPTPLSDKCPTWQGITKPPIADCIETDMFEVQGKVSTVAGLTVDQVTYSRSSTTGGSIDAFVSSEPDAQQAIVMTDVSSLPATPEFAPTGLKGSVATAGRYFAHVNYIGAEPPTKVQLSNTGDVPVTNKVADVVDKITGTAVYTTGIGDLVGSLTINALSSDQVGPRILTASGFAAASQPLVAGTLTVPLEAPPLTVTVSSDAGGTVKLPVEIVDGAAVPIPVVANAGPNQIVAAGQQVTLDGSASTGAGLVYAWTSATGIALSDPIAVNPTFTAPAVPGIHVIELTVVGLGGMSTATVTITVAHPPSSPLLVAVTPGDTTAMVNWTAPADDGGSPLIRYDVQMVDAFGIQIGALLPAAAGATSLEVTGLTNGTPVTFLVSATNEAVTGAYSDPPVTVTPTGPPSAPVIGIAAPGDTMVTVTWTAPADGGSPITGYDVQQVDAAGLPVGLLLPVAAGLTTLDVTGLVNGIAVQFQVQATSLLGTSAFSASSLAVIPGVVPSAPVIGIATAADATATVAWSVPVSDGGSAITGYNVQQVDAAGLPLGAPLPAAAGATSLIVPGLVNGTAVRFQVQATNGLGSGAFSASSNDVIPMSVPSAPVIGAATPADGMVTVTWTAPADGGSPITGYDVQQVDDAGLPVGLVLPVAAGITTLDVTGLVNGIAVRFQVQASNILGASPFSASSTDVIPGVVPSAPVIGIATATDATATVAWSVPVSDGGSPITGYNVQQVDAAGLPLGAVLPAGAGATSLVVPGLVNGTAVQFQVQAINGLGSGAFSTSSNAVIPGLVPSAPVIGIATATAATATVVWSVPVNDGGSVITGYNVQQVDAAGLPLGALLPAAADATSLVVTGLVNGTAVRFQVQATNAIGPGDFSAPSNAVIPIGAPSAPVIGIATAGNLSATVNWIASANGGSAIIRYDVQQVDAAGAPVGAVRTAAVGATSLVVTGLVNGTAVRFQVSAVNAVGSSLPSAPSNFVTPTPTRLSDFNRDGFTDVVARDNTGTLWLYPGNAAGGFQPRKAIGTGWGIYSAIVSPGDVTGDGDADILARDSAGRLWLNAGDGASGVANRREIGTGWNLMTAITGVGDMTSDGHADILARDKTGNLWLYPMTGNGVFQARRLIGTGWNVMTAITGPGDFSGDNRADILARDYDGRLWLYRGNGAGGVSARTQTATNWQGMTALVTPGDWNHDGVSDLLARDAAGTLWLYPGNNVGGFISPRRPLNTGWNGYTFG